jgi:hypothetical protein
MTKEVTGVWIKLHNFHTTVCDITEANQNKGSEISRACSIHETVEK